jgi:hypothetical protein
MYNLYYVKAFNHRLNEWARFLITSASPEGSGFSALEYLSNEWVIETIPRFVCTTTQQVSIEL